jgi:hypothetical protein
MKMLTCAAARRRLHAYHDEELSISDQIRVSAHLDWCEPCASSLDELRQLRDALRRGLPGRRALSHFTSDEELTLQRTVVSRIKAEETLSFGVWARELFADMHFVYAGLSSMAAALACVAIMLGMMRFATNERPDSTAAMVRVYGSSGSNLNPVSVSPRLLMPRVLDAPIWATPVAGADAIFTLSAVVTREGRIGNFEVLKPNGGRWIPNDRAEAKAVKDLLGVVSQAHFEPASIAGLPVAVNMVWIVDLRPNEVVREAHTTVHATKGPLDLPALRAPYRRGASI